MKLCKNNLIATQTVLTWVNKFDIQSPVIFVRAFYTPPTFINS